MKMRSYTHLRSLLVVAAIVLAAASCGTSTGGGTGGSAPSSTAPAGASKATTATAPAPAAINATGLLKGNARPSFPAGEAGKLTVVAMGSLSKDVTSSASMPIAIRNNTSKGVAHVDVTGVARTAGGKQITTGTSQGTTPAQIPPGGVALAYVYFEHAKQIGAGSKFTFTFETMPADQSSYNTASLKTVESQHSADSVTGSGVNDTGKPVTGPYAVDVYCFHGNRLTGTQRSFADQDDDVKPNGKVTFTADLYGLRCPQYLVGITGYFA